MRSSFWHSPYRARPLTVGTLSKSRVAVKRRAGGRAVPANRLLAEVGNSLILVRGSTGSASYRAATVMEREYHALLRILWDRRPYVPGGFLPKYRESAPNTTIQKTEDKRSHPWVYFMPVILSPIQNAIEMAAETAHRMASMRKKPIQSPTQDYQLFQTFGFGECAFGLLETQGATRSLSPIFLR